MSKKKKMKRKNQSPVKALQTVNYMVTPQGAIPIKGMGTDYVSDYLQFLDIQGASGIDDSNTGMANNYLTSVLSWRCINVKANAIAGLPLSFTDSKDNPIESGDPRMSYVRALDVTQSRLWRTLAKDYNIWGVGYWYPLWKKLYSQKRMAIQRLNPLTIQVESDSFVGIKHFRQTTEMGSYEIPPDEMVYFFDYDPFDDFGSVSPTLLALQAAGIETGLQEYVNRYFQNSAIPGGILSLANQPTPEISEAERMEAEWNRQHQGTSNAGKVAILGNATTFQQLTPNIKDLILKELGEATSFKICEAYGVPMTLALATEAANYATADISRKSFYTETILPEMDFYLDTINSQLASWANMDVIVKVDTAKVEVLQEDRIEITQRATQNYAGGIITLNEARVAQELPEIPGGDVLLMNGQPVPLGDLASGNLPAAQPAFPFASANLNEDAQKELDTPNNSEPLWIGLQFGALPDLVVLQNKLKKQFDNVRWEDPSDFHITLCYVPECEHYEAVLSQLQSLPIPDLSVSLGALYCFDSLSEYAIHFRIRNNQALREYQMALYEILSNAGMETSQFSNPATYKPHITMGYGQAPIPYTAYRNTLKLCPKSVKMDYGEETIYEKTLHSESEQPPEPPATKSFSENEKMDIIQELKRWHKKAVTKGKDASFSSQLIPSAITGFIKMDLDVAENEEAIKSSFNRAIEWIKATDKEAATPDEFERYWKNIGDLYEEFRAYWHRMLKEIPGIIDGVNPDAIPEIIQDYFEAQNIPEQLSGNEEKPGLLTKIILAGGARGADIVTANPMKARSISPLMIVWDIFNQQAVNAANQMSVTLAGQIASTTSQAYQTAIADWIEKGGALGDLSLAIQGELSQSQWPAGWNPKKLKWATSYERAAMIAQTETTRVFHEGVTRAWQEAGVKEFRWRTQNDSLVCPLCKSLNNKVGKLRVGVEYKGKSYEPPAHVGCRCFSSPIA